MLSSKIIWENSNISSRSCYLKLTLHSCKYFTRKCVADSGENYQLDLGSNKVKSEPSEQKYNYQAFFSFSKKETLWTSQKVINDDNVSS